MLLSWLFFRRLYAAALLSPGLWWYHRERQLSREKRELSLRRRQCADAFLALASNVSAGYALENAVVQSRDELSRLWGESSFVVREWRMMEQQLSVFHVPMEQAFDVFARRSGVAEACQLAQLLVIAKRSGGDVAALLRLSATQLKEATAVELEIQTGIAQMKYEQGIMTAMPPLMLLYVQVGMPDMMEAMYETQVGIIVMFSAFIIYIVAIAWGKRVSEITV